MKQSLAENITRFPVNFDSALSLNLLSHLPGDLTCDEIGKLIGAVAGCSPYLSGLLLTQNAWLTEILKHPSEDVIPKLIFDLKSDVEKRNPDWATFKSKLRNTKARAALFVALCDLGGLWGLPDVTENITCLADGLTDCALRYCLADEIARGNIPGLRRDSDPSRSGLFVIAMGKMGARELNYSSDIDLICLFDQAQYEIDARPEVRTRFIAVIRNMIKALSELTSDGYVFRTDLRLRPNPSVTPVCMSVDAAEQYYMTIGRTWERAAYIKARVVAGDFKAGRKYLNRLVPFIWRDPLDFAATQDIENILRKIRDHKWKLSSSGLQGYDIKLGPGGIREIELFTQTRQLTMGGRLPVLRDPTTLGALEALRDESVIDSATCDTQIQAYIEFRRIEHRLQMVHDTQSQTVPDDVTARSRVAALDGFNDLEAWETRLLSHLTAAHGVTQKFFDTRSQKPALPSLDQSRITDLGFTSPDQSIALLKSWRSGNIRATSSDRSSQLYRSIEAELLKSFGKAKYPDLALARFDRFLSTAKNVEQIFSMLKSHPELIDTVRHVFASAPRLANRLANWPETMDAILEQDIFDTFPSQDWLEADLHIRIGSSDDFEHILDVTRIWARETRLRVSLQLLAGKLDGIKSGKAFSTIANCVLSQLISSVTEQYKLRHGTIPGRGMAVIAFGKFGTQEMTDQSDLDLVTVYDAGRSRYTSDTSARSFGRLTRALISALSVQTAQGYLYPIDMRLRPSGNKGPVAVSLSAFENHQLHAADVWEHLALTRARIISGEPTLVAEIGAIIQSALQNRIGQTSVLGYAREMRHKLKKAHYGVRHDPWSLKYTSGGVMEIEFLTQTGALITGKGAGRFTRDVLPLLGESGWIKSTDADALCQSLNVQTTLLQLQSVAFEKTAEILKDGEEIHDIMRRTTGDVDFRSLEKRLKLEQDRAASICTKVFQDEG